MADPSLPAAPAASTHQDRPAGPAVAALGGGALLTALIALWGLAALADDPTTYHGAVSDYIAQPLAERFPAHVVLVLPLGLAIMAHRRARRALPKGHGIHPDPLVRRGRRAALATYWLLGLDLAVTPFFLGFLALSYVGS